MTILEKIAEIEKRAEAATAGPWEVVVPTPDSGAPPLLVGETVAGSGEDQMIGKSVLVLGEGDRPEDQVFIASARTDVPALCAALKIAVEALEQINLSNTSWRENLRDGSNIAAYASSDALRKIEKTMGVGE